MKVEKFNNYIKITATDGCVLYKDGKILSDVAYIASGDSADNYTEVIKIEEPPVEYINTHIQDMINMKIEELRQLCNEDITKGFESDCLGYVKHFDCEVTDQLSIQNLNQIALNKESAQTKYIIGKVLTEYEKEVLNEELLWKGSGELTLYKFTIDQVKTLTLHMTRHINKNIEKFNALRKKALECKTDEEIYNIKWRNEVR